MLEQEADQNYPMRLTTTLPLWLYIQLMEAIGDRAMRLVGENHPKQNKVVSHAEDQRAISQARHEAVQEALEDWLAKEKSEKWEGKAD